MTYRLLLPLILLLNAFPANAADPWFEVELLLFQRNAELESISEDLGQEKINIDLTSSIPLVKTQTEADCLPTQFCMAEKNPVLIAPDLFNSDNNHFQQLSNNKLQMSEQREKLNKHAAFTPVLHVVWRMPVKSRYAAKPIYIFAGENFAQSTSTPFPEDSLDSMMDNEPIEELISEDSTVELINEEYGNGELTIASAETSEPVMVNKWAIEGNFKVFLDHFLFIDSQLVVRQQVTKTVETISNQENNIEVISSENDLQVIQQSETIEPIVLEKVTELKEVQFDQNRRLRSEEIHYFDHPLMGMIVQIRKIPEAEKAKLETVSETVATEETNTDNTL